MCGIAGFTGYGNKEHLSSMIDAIKYRGPDAQLCHSDEQIHFAHARLSILDLRPEGNQPMFTPDKQFCIVFNGEIYNYIELKKELQKKYQFITSTDTEVLLYLYKEHGVKMLEMINGMFAFAIYDREKKDLFLARDRMGKKPLYYSEQKEGFIFASELKSILTHPSVNKEADLEAINQYLTFDYIPTPNSFVRNVYKLESGHYLLVKENKIQTKKAYWENDFSKKLELSFDEAKNKLDSLLSAATARRLMSDVPLGVFLSGGLDSSAIAYYAQKSSTHKIKTFSIGFEDKSYDEAGYAEKVAKHLNTEHHAATLTARKTLQLLDEVLPLLDEPFADASLLPTYFLSKFTKQHVTVALGGDGSDELSAGYPTFISEKFKAPFHLLPSTFSKAFLNISNTLLPSSDKNISFDFKVKQYLRGFQSSPAHLHQLWLGSFLPDEKKELFNQEIYQNLKDKNGLKVIDHWFEQCDKNWSHFDRLTYYYYKTYLIDDILFKVDRASMYSSLEVRAPFLDKEVVEFFNALPKNYKQKGLNGKHILKEVMKDKLPMEIIKRPKKGFGIPLSDWIRKDLKSEIQDVLYQSDPLFKRETIEKLVEEHMKNKRNHRKLIWNLYILKRKLHEMKLSLC